MNAILITKGTINDCNLNSESDKIGLQCRLGSSDFDFCKNLVKINFRLLQSYLVLFGKDWNYIWSD